MKYDINKLPREIITKSKITNSIHCQGIATDGEFMYYSFTTNLLKTDMQGNFVGVATGLTGHLGCIAYNDADGCVYASLEYKNDCIGQVILKELGIKRENVVAFYIAKIDVSKINGDVNAIDDGVITLLKTNDTCKDFIEHNFSCAGIDGITFIPSRNGKRVLALAYGITINEADDQVILTFDFDRISDKFEKIIPGSDTTDGIWADEKLFVHTGNTDFGIQNLEYDPHMECLIAAVYPGKSKVYPNRYMYFIDLTAPEYDKDGKHYLPLAKRGLPHESGVYGSDFTLGAYGTIALGDGYYYFADHKWDGSSCQAEVTLHRLVGDGDFEKVTD